MVAVLGEYGGDLKSDGFEEGRVPSREDKAEVKEYQTLSGR